MKLGPIAILYALAALLLVTKRPSTTVANKLPLPRERP
jgi:hypothetical protein